VFFMDEFELYLSGMSIPEVSDITGISRSTIRSRLNNAGILRSRAEGVRAAAEKGKLGLGNKGKKRVFTDQWKENISKGKLEHGKINALSVRVNKSGYMEFTRGDNKGRLVHCVVIESRLGRKLYKDECVHHIDRDKLNNQDSNLALMTISGHARLHRYEDKISNNLRERNQNGTWS